MRRAMIPIETPCTNVCTVDNGSGLCIGCGRTLSEIAEWPSLSATERRRVMAELPQRIARLNAKRVAQTGLVQGAPR